MAGSEFLESTSSFPSDCERSGAGWSQKGADKLVAGFLGLLSLAGAQVSAADPVGDPAGSGRSGDSALSDVHAQAAATIDPAGTATEADSLGLEWSNHWIPTERAFGVTHIPGKQDYRWVVAGLSGNCRRLNWDFSDAGREFDCSTSFDGDYNYAIGIVADETYFYVTLTAGIGGGHSAVVERYLHDGTYDGVLIDTQSLVNAGFCCGHFSISGITVDNAGRLYIAGGAVYEQDAVAVFDKRTGEHIHTWSDPPFCPYGIAWVESFRSGHILCEEPEGCILVAQYGSSVASDCQSGSGAVHVYSPDGTTYYGALPPSGLGRQAGLDVGTRTLGGEIGHRVLWIGHFANQSISELIIPTPLTPSEMLAELRSIIQSLDLARGLVQSLLAKLDAAAQAVDRGDDRVARAQLGSLGHQVEAQRGVHITAEDADMLTAMAETIMSLLGGSDGSSSTSGNRQPSRVVSDHGFSGFQPDQEAASSSVSSRERMHPCNNRCSGLSEAPESCHPRSRPYSVEVGGRLCYGCAPGCMPGSTNCNPCPDSMFWNEIPTCREHEEVVGDGECFMCACVGPIRHSVAYDGDRCSLSTSRSLVGIETSGPNPFRSVTRIVYSLEWSEDARVAVYDVTGRRVAKLATGAGAGRHAVTWDGRDEAGRTVGPGVYFIRVEAGRETQMRKVVFSP